MTPALQVVLSGTLTFGVPLVIAVRELFTTARGGGGGGGGRAPERRPPPLPPGSGSLPPCLTPQRIVPVLEPEVLARLRVPVGD